MNAWKERRTSSPFKSLNFLKDAEKLLNTSFSLEDYTNLANLLLIFKALTTHLLAATSEKIKSFLQNGCNEFEAKNESQFFMARTLSLSFIQMTMLDRFINYINDRDVNLTISEKEVMKKLGIIYAL